MLRTDQLGFSVDGSFDAATPTQADAATGEPDRASAAGEDGKRAEGSLERRPSSTCPYMAPHQREGLKRPMLLWDATMAHSISRALEAEADRRVVHVCEASPEPEPEP